jgi:hypothetical protein
MNLFLGAYMNRILGILIVVILTGNTFAQVTSEPTPQGPRAIGLAGTYVAVANDGWAMFHNPAGLAQVKNIQAFGSYQRLYISSLKSMMGGAVMPLGTVIPDGNRFGTIGLSVERLSTGVDGDQSLTGDSRTLSSEMSMGLSYGVYLLKDLRSSLAFGTNFKMMYLDYGKSAGASGTGEDGVDLGNIYKLGIDLGLMASIRDRAYIGAFIMNLNDPKIGTTGQVRELPHKLIVGAGYIPYDGVLTAVAVEKSRGRDTRIKGGIEAKVMDQNGFRMDMRFGVMSTPNVYTLGLGAIYKGFHLDYALMIHPILPVTHQVGMLYSFGE